MRSCFSKRWINLGFFDYWPTNAWYIVPWVVTVHVFRPSLLLACACLLSIQSYSGKRPCFQFNQLCMITAALCHQEASAGPTAPGLISSPCAPVGYHAPGLAKSEVLHEIATVLFNSNRRMSFPLVWWSRINRISWGHQHVAIGVTNRMVASLVSSAFSRTCLSTKTCCGKSQRQMRPIRILQSA